METSERPKGADGLAKLLTTVQRIEDAVSRCLSGHGDEFSTFSQVHDACEQLRTAGLDEVGEHLVWLIERAAALLQEALTRPAQRVGFHGADASEIRLLKGVSELEAYLETIPDGGEGN